MKQLESWAQEEPEHELGAAFVYVQPYEHDGEADEDMLEESGTDFVVGLRQAKLEYIVELHANNDEFRLYLAQIISGARAGIWVDHLTGEWGKA